MAEGLSPGAVSRRLGIAVTTLRSWHQRYGLGPSRHEAGSHRRYSENDLIQLETMRLLTGQGVPASEAARVARSAGNTFATTPGRPGGIPRKQAGDRRAARGITSAAMRLDSGLLRERIIAQVSTMGVAEAWTRVLVPVLAGIGQRNQLTGRFIEVEHLVSRCLTEVFATVARPTGAASASVLLACAPEEQHTLPLEAMAAALAERSVTSLLLGARVPTCALVDAIRRTGPAMVALWSQRTLTSDPVQLDPLLRLRPRPAAIVAAGPGWTELPDGILRPTTLHEAITIACHVTPTVRRALG